MTSPVPGSMESILVVDDDEAVLSVVAKVLSRQGYRVSTASNGEAGLKVAAEADEPFALMVTDMVMPGMNGRELAEAMAVQSPSTLVLYMSAYTEDEILRKGVRASDVHFISKPFTVDGLREKVRNVLDGTA